MEVTDILPVLLTGGLFIISFISLLLVAFNAMLSPLRKDINRLDTDIKANKQELKAEIQAVNAKLDQLILNTVKNNAQKST